MSEFREYRELMRMAREIARHPVDAKAAREAVEAVRRGLGSAPARRRWVLPAGAAIAAIMLIGLFLLTPGSNSRSFAAEQAEQVAKASRAYKGWVHVHYDPPIPIPTTAPAIGPVKQIASHYNTADGTSIREDSAPAGRVIDMTVPSQKVWNYYDGHDLHIASIDKIEADMFAGNVNMRPVTVAEMMSQFAASPDGAKTITRQEDGRLIRLDFSGPDGARGISVWADAKTHLIQKVRRPGPDGVAMIASYTYGEPEIHDVYDAGVPRDAHVIDERPARDVAQTLEKLYERAVKGFGDAVAVVCVETSFPGGRTNPDHSEIILFAHEGDKGLSARYSVAGQASVKHRAIILPPAHWPTPSLQEVYDVIKAGIPIEAHVSNGNDTWQGLTMDLDQFAWQGRFGEARQNLYLYSIGSVIWPTREDLGLGVPGATTKIISDPRRPGLLGIFVGVSDVTDTYGFPAARIARWIDPAHDDMPVETMQTDLGAPHSSATVYRLRFLKYAQLPDGRWYPTLWQREMFDEKGKPIENSIVMTFHLAVYPGVRVDPKWYTEKGNPLAKAK